MPMIARLRFKKQVICRLYSSSTRTVFLAILRPDHLPAIIQFHPHCGNKGREREEEEHNGGGERRDQDETCCFDRGNPVTLPS